MDYNTWISLIFGDIFKTNAKLAQMKHGVEAKLRTPFQDYLRNVFDKFPKFRKIDPN